MPKHMESGRTQTYNKEDHKYEYTYRIIMEKHLGRKLRPDEQIHHKNGNAMDNRIENLELVTMAEHNKVDPKHHLGGRYAGDSAGDK